MRILILSSEYPPHGNGIGSYAGVAAPALAARGHEVHVLSCGAGRAAEDAEEHGVLVHRRPLRRLRGVGRVARHPALAARVRQAVTCAAEARRLGRFDVVEAPDWLAEGLLVRGAPLVAHLHTPVGLTARVSGLRLDRGLRLADRLERAAVRRARAVTSPSRLLAERLADEGWLGRPAGAVAIVRYPVDLARWADVPAVERTAPLVLAAGRLERRKAPETLVDACASLADEIPDLELVLVGRSAELREGRPYGEWLAARARVSGVPLRLVEEVPRAELAAWYGRARAVAVPSAFDNFPMAALEALAAGRPVACTEQTGTAELLRGSEGGAVVPFGDPARLADALRPYLADPAAAGRAGRAARRLVEAECDPDRIAAERERVYAGAAGA